MAGIGMTATSNTTSSSITVDSGNKDIYHPPLPDDDLPTNVSHESQLSGLPKECLAILDDDGNTDGQRPLRHVDDRGNEYFYSLRPFQYSVSFILLVELFERFAFYGIYYTLTLYLTGAYDHDWNAGFSSVEASALVSASTMIAYTTPFVGAYFSDFLFGDYPSLLIGLLCFYIPGVALIVATTVPNLFGGENFNTNLLTAGILFLWPLGTGLIKSIVNVFGAKQFHPVLQSSLIESYYISFYTAINIGALAGSCIIPVLAQTNLFLAYVLPMSLLVLAALCLVLGTPRYITTQPRPRPRPRRPGSGSHNKGSVWPCGGGSESHKFSKIRKLGGPKATTLSDSLRISLCVVPFCVGYNQMPTTFEVQGAVMAKAFGIFDVASMNSLDPMSVLVFGSITANYIYPCLAQRGIKVATSHRFAIGSFLGAMAVAWAIFVEHMIRSTYEHTGEQVNVLWQAPSYILIGFGEIFAVSTAYEVAFTASPPDQKVLASAINIFCVGGLPNLICIVLVHSCKKWFTNSRGDENIGRIEDYATAHVSNYFGLLLLVMIFGVVINVVPSIKEFVESIEERASDLMKTPKIIPSLRKHQREDQDQQKDAKPFDEESSPLLVTTPRTKKYKQDLKYGSGPIYTRSNSMRAGPSLSRRDLPGGKVRKIKYKAIPKLYGGKKERTNIRKLTRADGKTINVESRDGNRDDEH